MTVFDAYSAAQAQARARRRLQLARGRQRHAARPRLRRRGPRPRPGDVLRRRADARVAGPRAERRPRPAAARRADQPPRHHVARVARDLPDRASTPPSSSSPTTAGSWRRSAPRVLELEGGRARFFAGTWHAWRKEKAQRELALGRAIEKQKAEIAKLQRFVDRFSAGTRARAGAVARQAARQDRQAQRTTRRDTASLGFAFKKPERTGRVIFELEDARVTRRRRPRVLLDDAEFWLERGEHVSLVGANGTGKSTLLQGPHRRAASSTTGKLRKGHNLKLGLLSQHAEVVGATGHRARVRPARHRPQAQRDARAARAASCSAARRPRSRSTACQRRRAPAALARLPGRVGRQRPRARRADQPPRPREPRGARVRAAGLHRRRPARLPRPRAARRRRHPHRRGRGRHAALLRRRLARVRARPRGARGAAEAEGRRSAVPKRESPLEAAHRARSRRGWRRSRAARPTRRSGELDALYEAFTS